jgi:hypothetical protein
MKVALRHPETGDVKFVPLGWSWSLFLGAGLFGLPLFTRGLALWGTGVLALWCLQFAVPLAAAPDADADLLQDILFIAAIGVCVYLGGKGNALSGKHYLACGYDFAEPNAMEARLAVDAWGV